jgi:Asp-tRNA(Asn)/Glu-tRNA(Gln) amidotransferase A subunit family amidase
VPAPLEGPSPAKPIKVALARIPDDMETDAAVLALLRTAAGHLVDAGYDVVETELPDLERNKSRATALDSAAVRRHVNPAAGPAGRQGLW